MWATASRGRVRARMGWNIGSEAYVALIVISGEPAYRLHVNFPMCQEYIVKFLIVQEIWQWPRASWVHT